MQRIYRVWGWICNVSSLQIFSDAITFRLKTSSSNHCTKSTLRSLEISSPKLSSISQLYPASYKVLGHGPKVDKMFATATQMIFGSIQNQDFLFHLKTPEHSTHCLHSYQHFGFLGFCKNHSLSFAYSILADLFKLCSNFLFQTTSKGLQAT